MVTSKLYKSKAWLAAQRKKGRSTKEIADQCGVSQQMIQKQMKEFGLK